VNCTVHSHKRLEEATNEYDRYKSWFKYKKRIKETAGTEGTITASAVQKLTESLRNAEMGYLRSRY